MKTYEANRESWGRSIKVTEGSDYYWLDPRPSQNLINHSPDAFEWGYGGSGPSQLALAILLDVLGKDRKDVVLSLYHQFKFSFIANCAKEGFVISEEAILTWIRDVTKPGTVA